ncbi:UDP-glucuronosyltransferase 2B31-like [Patiria miniata]|uniref:Uncharacterized protein n=1 Tax=Patiria miniata TaxID=46514 RepID=A0A913Z3M0_PATMI|nr:UDP-glucuronosyltransferase 2B31-like [Patiria miniata]
MSSRLVTFLCLLLTSLEVISAMGGSDAKDSPAESPSEKFKFLYFGSIIGGSHYSALCKSGRELVRRHGHKVVSLISSSNTIDWQKDGDLFSFVVFSSSYTKRDRAEVMESVSAVLVTGALAPVFGPVISGVWNDLSGVAEMWLRECDVLLGDAKTMDILREERFDMLVADDTVPCSPLLAQALEIPFVLNSFMSVVPTKHGPWTGLPIDPSYIPERSLGFTDRMTFFQRVQNVLAHTYYGFYHYRLGLANFDSYDALKIKYNIRPDISTFESHKQALLLLLHGSFALEFPRPLLPNTVHVLHTPGLSSNQTIEDDVAEFLGAATDGIVLFSFGTFARSMRSEQAQMFADGFAMLPYRVLWQTSTPPKLQLGQNTKLVKWLPLPTVMEHPSVKVFVSQCGAYGTYEAMWAGLPLVGIPLQEDQMGNIDRIVNRGAGLSLDITTLTPEILSQAIHEVVSEPKYRENARRVSLILRDLQTSSPPVETAAQWILHVTKFGGEHLRPAIHDLSYIQRNLLDVYLFLFVVSASMMALVITSCYCCCCKRTRRNGSKDHVKHE